MMAMQRQRFRDRTEAGQLLAAKLGIYANRSDVLVLGLARGEIPVAFEIARALRAPLDPERRAIQWLNHERLIKVNDGVELRR